MFKNSIFIGALLVILSMAVLGLFQSGYEYLVMGRDRWAWQYSAMFIGAGLALLAIAWALRKGLAPRWRYWVLAIPVVSVGQIFLRMILLSFPSQQAALLKKGYLNYIDDASIYADCAACQYTHELDFFDRDLIAYFVQDTAFLRDYARICQLRNAARWAGGATYAANGKTLVELAGALHVLWQEAGIPLTEYLNQRHGDALLLAMAWAETQPRYEDALWQTHYDTTYRLDNNGLDRMPMERLSAMPARLPYFNQGWLDESNLRALYRHYLKKIDEIQQNELEVLLGLCLHFPARFLQPTDFDRLIERWKTFQEPFVLNIEAMQRSTDTLRRVFSPFIVGNRQQLLVYFEHPSDADYWTPWLHSMGYEPLPDSNGIALSADMGSRLLRSYDNPTYEYRTKERQVYNSFTKRYQTERYSEQVQTGTEEESIYSYSLALFYRLPTAERRVFLLETPELIFHPYYDAATEQYNLDYTFTERRPSWLYAIPKAYYAPTGDDW